MDEALKERTREIDYQLDDVRLCLASCIATFKKFYGSPLIGEDSFEPGEIDKITEEYLAWWIKDTHTLKNDLLDIAIEKLDRGHDVRTIRTQISKNTQALNSRLRTSRFPERGQMSLRANPAQELGGFLVPLVILGLVAMVSMVKVAASQFLWAAVLCALLAGGGSLGLWFAYLKFYRHYQEQVVTEGWEFARHKLAHADSTAKRELAALPDAIRRAFG